jgi:tyrosinase
MWHSLGEITFYSQVLNEYKLDVVPRFLFKGVPFSIHVLLEGQEVGRVENFSFVPGAAPDGTAACENCAVQQEINLILTNQVFLTHELVRAVPNGEKALNSLDKDAITNYLKEHLSWQVVMVRLAVMHLCVTLLI